MCEGIRRPRVQDTDVQARWLLVDSIEDHDSALPGCLGLLSAILRRSVARRARYYGGELFDIFAVPSEGGEPVNLTQSPDISEREARWSPDGNSIAISYRAKTAASSDIALLDWTSHKIRKLTDERDKTRSWGRAVWSQDGKFIYALRTNTNGTDSDVYRINVASAQLENLTEHKGEVFYLLSAVSPDGRSLLIGSNEKGGYNNVALLALATKKITWVTDLKWTAEPGNFSPDGQTFTYVVNEDGRSDTFVVDRQSGRASKLALPAGLNTPEGNPTAYSPTGRELLLSHQSSTQARDFWIYDLQRKDFRQFTYASPAYLSAARLPSSQLVHYRTFDGKIISAFLWVPFNLKRDGGNPGIVLVHGGPTSQTLDVFNRTAAALASRGYVCIAPNVRGSTGTWLLMSAAGLVTAGCLHRKRTL